MLLNENGPDRVIRIILGVVLLSLVFVGPQTPWGYVGVVLIITGVVGFCPIYKLLGLSTR
ncbi:YgaP family membrane protein [Alteromonas flava]|uniref:YgaP family membrane protein n=1 Tax=Alteromonas flava TaxID=2048003 RepID=UPI000C28B38A